MGVDCGAVGGVVDLGGAWTHAVGQGDNYSHSSGDANSVAGSDDAVDFGGIHDVNFVDAKIDLAEVAAAEGAERHLNFFERGFFRDTASSLVVQKIPMFWYQLCSTRDLFHFAAQARVRKN